MDKATRALRLFDGHRVGITLALALGVTALALVAFARDLAFYFTAMGEAMSETLPSGFDVAAGPELEAAAKRLGAWTILLLCGAELGILSAAYGLVNGIVALVIGAFSLRKAARERREQAGNIDKRLARMAGQLQARGCKTLFGYDGRGLRCVLYCNGGADRPVTAFRFHPHVGRYPASALADTDASPCWRVEWRVELGFIEGPAGARRFWGMPIELCDPASSEGPAEHLDYADGGDLVPRGKFATGGFDDPRIAKAMKRGLDRVGE